MSSRAVLVAAALCVVLLATGAAGAATSGDEPINVTTTNETAVIEVEPCEGIGCWFLSEPYDLYINGEHEQSLDYGDEYRVRDSDYTDDTAGVAVSNTGLVTDDKGWGYQINRTYPAEQASDEKGDERRDNRSSVADGAANDESPPKGNVEHEKVDGFGDCMAEDRLKFLDPRVDEGKYCYDEAF